MPHVITGSYGYGLMYGLAGLEKRLFEGLHGFQIEEAVKRHRKWSIRHTRVVSRVEV